MPKHSDAAILDAYDQAGTKAGAARLLSMDERGYKRRFKKIAPSRADGYQVTASMQDGDGNIKIQWLKPTQEKQGRIFQEMLDGFKAKLPREKAVPASVKPKNDEIINLIPIADFHMGMKAWAEETKCADWDLSIAEDLFVKWFLVATHFAPDSEKCLLVLMGDFLHWDGMDAVTPESRHVVDADTRYQKIVRVAISALRRVVRILLKKHSLVHIKVMEGNHDPASSAHFREWLPIVYEKEPRVEIDTSPNPYGCYEFEKNALFFHHGHKRKVGNIDHVFTALFRETFGRTTRAYAHMAHLHHDDVKETNLMRVEQHRSLAAHDAYASRGGWLAERDAKIITYHKDYGETSRATVPAEMVVAWAG